MKKIAIIGAGVAGLKAATKLAEHQVEIHIFEQTSKLGGRCYSFEHKPSATIVDNGQHLMMGCYYSFLKMLDKFGTRDLFKQIKGLRIPFILQNSRVHYMDCSQIPGKIGLLWGMLNYTGASLGARLQFLNFMTKFSLRLLHYQDLTVYELLKKEKQGDDLIKSFWEPLVIATLNSDIQRASAAMLLQVLRKAFFADSNASSLLIPKVPLSSLFEPALNYLRQNNINIHFKTKVKSIRRSNLRCLTLKLSDGSDFDADYIISTVPYFALANIIPAKYRIHPYFATLEHYEHSPIISAYFWYNKELTDEPMTALLETQTQWIFNRNRFMKTEFINPHKFPGAFGLTISGADELIALPKEELMQLCKSEIENAIPKSQVAELLHWKIIKERRATFLPTPQLEPFRLRAFSPINGLLVAGDWTATTLPSTIEGAAVSGANAADFIISKYKL